MAINLDRLKAVLTEYKKIFTARQWPEEKYKWVAVQHFQDNWNIDAPDFAKMLTEALAKTANLLASSNNFPGRMINNFAKVAPGETKAMFVNLFDEALGLTERMAKFKSDAEHIRAKCDDGSWKHHFQSENAISAYLWLRYPEKYYIYKFSEYKTTAKILDNAFIPKKGDLESNVINGFKMYDEICKYLKEDTELVQMLRKAIDDNNKTANDKCYSDDALKTLTIDIGFYVSNSYQKWIPENYSPEITADQWLLLLGNKDIFTDDSLKVMKRIKVFGGIATCSQLASKYGDTINFYNAVSSFLAKRVADSTNCPLLKDYAGNSVWWPILYLGRNAGKNTEGSFVWKLRDELNEALDKFDLSAVPLYNADADTNTQPNIRNNSAAAEAAVQGYWWLNANPRIWSFSNLAVGNTQGYTLYNENGNKRRIFQNFLDAKAGDLVIGYESSPVKQIVALAKVFKENDGTNIHFEKTDELAVPIDYAALINCPELEQMEYFANPQGSLFKLTGDEYSFIMDIIRDENPIQSNIESVEYSKADFLNEVFMSNDDYDTLVSLLKNKLNVILKGAPGVGKTFAAKRLAYSIMGKKDDSRIEFLQFHQNYSYEDFIMGYKPAENGFELRNGVFYRFCRKAANMPDEPFFFIIDEINRGNMSKIFGELLMLIEKDYRGTSATLAYNGLPFSVPKNLYIIGMMNTSDRSLAMIDYALRRRFSFFEMQPGFDSDGFNSYKKNIGSAHLDILIKKVKELNGEISSDSSLGSGCRIGHSYFYTQDECTDAWLRQVVEYEILPMLEEYWFDDFEKVESWKEALRGVFND